MFKIYDQGVLAGMIVKSEDINDELPKEKYAIYSLPNTSPFYIYTKSSNSNSLLDKSILLVDSISDATNILLNYWKENRMLQNIGVKENGYYNISNVQIRKNGLLIAYDVKIQFTDYNSGSMQFENTVLQGQTTYEIYHFANKITNVVIAFVGGDKNFATFLRDYSAVAKQGNNNE